jgi:hypothetical protein
MYLAAHYGDAWRRVFTGKSTKQIWAVLTEGGRKPPSLSTFYSHIRHGGLDGILNQYLCYDEVELICRTLKIKDNKITSLIAEIEQLQKEVQTMEARIRAEMFV